MNPDSLYSQASIPNPRRCLSFTQSQQWRSSFVSSSLNPLLFHSPPSKPPPNPPLSLPLLYSTLFALSLHLSIMCTTPTPTYPLPQVPKRGTSICESSEFYSNNLALILPRNSLNPSSLLKPSFLLPLISAKPFLFPTLPLAAVSGVWCCLSVLNPSW